MGISSTETNLGLKKILEEKGITFSSGNTTNLSLRGLSINGTGNDAADYFDEASQQYVNVDGTPNSSAPYGIAEFRGYSHIQYTFNMRGSNSSEPSINKDIRATSSTYDDEPDQIARTDVFYYVYYKSNGNLAITATSAVTANQTFGNQTYRKWVEQDGTVNTLSGSNQMSEPGIEILNVASGYTVRFEVDQNEGSQTAGVATFTPSVLPSDLGSMSKTNDTWTHSGTASIPIQSAAQNTGGTYPLTTRVKVDADASTVTGFGNNSTYLSTADYSPAFRFIFEKTGEPTITIYCKAKMYAQASNAF